MKKAIFFLISLAILLAGGCKKEDFDPVNQNRTYLHFLNAYGDALSVDVHLQSFETNGIFASQINFLEGWPKGGYASLLTNAKVDSVQGEGEVFIKAVSRSNGKELMSFEGLFLNPDVRSTLALIDSFGKAKFVKTIDLHETPGSDTIANIRFMNVNYTQVSVSLQTFDLSFSIDRLNFLNYSRFTEIKPGTYDFRFVNDQGGNQVAELRNVTIEPRKTYSFFLTQDRNGANRGGYEVLE